MKQLVIWLVIILGAIGTAFANDPKPQAATGPTPTSVLPPGALDDDRGPSPAIFPPQKLTIRFNHKFHVEQQKLKCTSCHQNATTSQTSRDILTPGPQMCDQCHGSDHHELAQVQPGQDESGKCGYCHLGYKDGDGNKVAKFEIPRPNLVFSHAKHATRNINCQQCHGDVQETELATRDQLPRMRGCFGCHQHPEMAARGDAKSTCDTCHIKGGSSEGNRIKTAFASGVMEPPRWMHNAQHSPDFIQRHKMVAANDYLNMHATEARLATQKCTSCHREQTFCLGCHQRLGITMSGPTDVREAGRFHPPKSEWSDPPRKPGHHAFEAMRNLNACVSCHIERDCVVCHGGQGVGGGFNPHNGSFAANCGSQFRRNPRPCFVCHEPGSADLQRCQ